MYFSAIDFVNFDRNSLILISEIHEIGMIFECDFNSIFSLIKSILFNKINFVKEFNEDDFI